MTGSPIRLTVAAAIVALVLAACGSSSSSGGGGGNGGGGGSGSSGGTTTLQFGLFGAQSDAGLLIAQDKGYFKQEGLNLNFVSSPSPDQAEALLAAGKLDMAGISPSPGFFNAIAQGVKVRILADKGQVGPAHSWVAVVVRKSLWDSGKVRSLADLKGRTIGSTGVVSSTGAEFAKALTGAGLSLSDVHLQQAANPADTLTALTNGAIDAAVLQEPFVTLAQVTGAGHVMLQLGSVLPDGENGVIAVGSKFAAQPSVLRRFMKAYLKGIAAYQAAFPANGQTPQDRQAIEQILIKHTAVKKPSLYQKMQTVQFSSAGSVNTSSIDYFQRFFMQQKLQHKFIPSSQYLVNLSGGQ